MWSDLPAHVVILIFSFLQDPVSRLCALSACRRWSEIILSAVILRTTQESGHTRWQHQQSISQHIYNPTSCEHIPRNDALVFKWCRCNTVRMVELMIYLLACQIEYMTVKQLHIKGHYKQIAPSIPMYHQYGHYLMAEKCYIMDVPVLDMLTRKTDTFLLLLRRCTGLEVLDLGFDPHLSNNAQIMQVITDKIKIGKLHALNIAAIRTTSPTVDNTLETISHLNMLTSLCLNFDKHFKDLVDVLSSGYNSETRLKQLTVVVSASFECKGVTTEMWSGVRRHYRDMKVGLVVVRDACDRWVFQRIEDLPADISVDMLIIMTNANYFSRLPDIKQYILRRINKSVEEISLHYVEIVFDRRNITDLAHITTLRSSCKNLKKLELCGMYIDFRDLLREGAKLGRGLRDFIVYKADVFQKNDVTGEWLALTGPQLDALEEDMSRVLGRDWRLVRTAHVNRHVDDERGRPQLERTLQEVCNVIQ